MDAQRNEYVSVNSRDDRSKQPCLLSAVDNQEDVRFDDGFQAAGGRGTLALVTLLWAARSTERDSDRYSPPKKPNTNSSKT